MGEAAGGRHQVASCRAGQGQRQRRMHGKPLSAWLCCGSGHSVHPIWPLLTLYQQGLHLLPPHATETRVEKASMAAGLPVMSQLHLTPLSTGSLMETFGISISPVLFPSLLVDPNLSYTCLSFSLQSHNCEDFKITPCSSSLLSYSDVTDCHYVPTTLSLSFCFPFLPRPPPFSPCGQSDGVSR